MTQGTGASVPDNTCRMCIVDQLERIVFLCKAQQFGQIRKVPVHTEYAIGNNHDSVWILFCILRKNLLQRTHVTMKIPCHFCSRHQSSVDEARVVQFIEYQ